MNIIEIIGQLSLENIHVYEGLVLATIAAVPATVGSIAAWKKADSANRKLKTSNGDSIGRLTEMNYELSKSVAHRQDELSKSLEVHILDQNKHCHEEALHRKGIEV